MAENSISKQFLPTWSTYCRYWTRKKSSVWMKICKIHHVFRWLGLAVIWLVNALERQFPGALFKLDEHGLERGRVRTVRELHGGNRGARLIMRGVGSEVG